jgi:hypothetical protein
MKGDIRCAKKRRGTNIIFPQVVLNLAAKRGPRGCGAKSAPCTKRNETRLCMWLRFRSIRGKIKTHLKANLANSFIDILVKVGGVIDEKGLGLDDTGDGAGSQADGAQDASDLVEVSRIGATLDELAGEDADESNLFSKALDAGVFNTGEITFVDAASVKAVTEGIEVTGLAAATTRGGEGGVWHEFYK